MKQITDFIGSGISGSSDVASKEVVDMGCDQSMDSSQSISILKEVSLARLPKEIYLFYDEQIKRSSEL